jgi:hypothetical protein
VASCCGKDLGIITEEGGLAIHYRGEAHSFAGMVQENGAENCSEKVLSLAANDVFENYWWYAFNTNVCFRGYVNIAPLHLFIKQEARQAANRLLGNGCSYVPNFGHSEVLIKIPDEMPLLLAPRDKFVTLNIFTVENFHVKSLLS